MKKFNNLKMPSVLLVLCASLIFFNSFAEELRTWRGKMGETIKASFVKFEDENVHLKLENGKIVQARESNLCDEDRRYIFEKSYVPANVEVSYATDPTGFLKEHGDSPAAMYRDQITFTLLNRQADGSQKTMGDSRWKYISHKVFKERMQPVRSGIEEALISEGNLVLLEFIVENDSALPVVVPPSLLIDQRGRKYLPMDNYTVEPYLPEGVMKTEADIVQPGFKKHFCCVYEVPPQTEVSALEVFPVKAQTFLVREFKITGKKLNFRALPAGAVTADSDDETDIQQGKPDFNIFLKCSRLAQGGSRTPGYYYDSNKKRSLAYGVVLRTSSPKTVTLLVKAFFIGQILSGKDVVVDKKESSIDFAPGRIEQLAMQSDEIDQNRHYYYKSESTWTRAKLKGVIIQVWWGDEILKSYSSVSQWRKYEESKDLVEELGEVLKERPRDN